MDSHQQQTACGFVTVVGPPNAGKSTLLNQMVGTKVSIVSPKVQTTRQRILGILIKEKTQIILVDTPGIFTPKRPLEKAIVKTAWEATTRGDMIAVIVDAHRLSHKTSFTLLEKLSAQVPWILVMNKIDLLPREQLLPLAESFNKAAKFDQTFMVSALTGAGVNDVSTYLAHHLPKGPWLYPEDQISDIPQRTLAAEIVREHLFCWLHQELPYALTVETESWEELGEAGVKISAVIYVARENHRPIILGKGGSTIKKIGTLARGELCKLFGRSVHLFLRVKVKENWPDHPERYRNLGLTFENK